MAGRAPDVIGYTLDDARQILAASGWTIGEIAHTAPPRRALLEPSRVVRQRVRADGALALVVCGERTDTGHA
jgi:beta-lactam-binding protein with PASTA domain